VYQNLNLSSLAQLQRTLYNLGDILHFGHTRLTECRLGAAGLDLLDHIEGTLLALVTGVVDNNIGATLTQLDSNGGTNSPMAIRVSSCRVSEDEDLTWKRR
jgi:hypothetical protein